MMSFEPERAMAAGISVRGWNFLSYALFGLVVTTFVRVGGVLMIFSQPDRAGRVCEPARQLAAPPLAHRLADDHAIEHRGALRFLQNGFAHRRSHCLRVGRCAALGRRTGEAPSAKLDQLTAMREAGSLRSLRPTPVAVGSSAGAPSTTK